MSKSIADIVGAFTFLTTIIILFIYRLGNIWPFSIIAPVLVYAFYQVNTHCKNVAEQLCLEDGAQLHEFDGNTAIVLVGNVTKANVGTLNYARSIGNYVIAMHISMDESVEREKRIQGGFKRHLPDVRLSIVHPSYHSLQNPILRYADLVSKNTTKHNYNTTVLMPQFIPNKRWQNILHNQTSLRLRIHLAWRENAIVATYSYHLKK